MASSGEESESGSGSDSRSDLKAATRKPSSAANASGTVQPVATPATSQPPAERAREGRTVQLSRFLLGRGGGVPTSTPKRGSRAAAPSKLPEEESAERDWASVSSLLQVNGMGLDEEVLRVGIRMIDRSKVEEIEERLREFRMAELQMAADRAVLTNEVAKLFMDAYRVARKM